MSNHTYFLHFMTEVQADVLSDGSYPIHDDEGKMVGGFVLKRDSLIDGVVALPEWHKLYVNTGIKAFFTPVEGYDGKVASGKLTEVKISALSVPIVLDPIE